MKTPRTRCIVVQSLNSGTNKIMMMTMVAVVAVEMGVLFLTCCFYTSHCLKCPFLPNSSPTWLLLAHQAPAQRALLSTSRSELHLLWSSRGQSHFIFISDSVSCAILLCPKWRKREKKPDTTRLRAWLWFLSLWVPSFVQCFIIFWITILIGKELENRIQEGSFVI